MKYSSLFFLLILVSGIYSYSQNTLDLTMDKVWYKFEEPEFEGAMEGFQTYICNALQSQPKKFRTEVYNQTWELIFTISKNQVTPTHRVIISGSNRIDMDTLRKTNSEKINDVLKSYVVKSRYKWKQALINETPVDIHIKILIDILEETDTKKCFLIGRYEILYDTKIAFYYYNEGVKMFESNKYAEAIKYFDETLYMTSKDIDALYNRGVCKFKLHDKEGACEDWIMIKSLGKPDADDLIGRYCN